MFLSSCRSDSRYFYFRFLLDVIVCNNCKQNSKLASRKLNSRIITSHDNPKVPSLLVALWLQPCRFSEITKRNSISPFLVNCCNKWASNSISSDLMESLCALMRTLQRFSLSTQTYKGTLKTKRFYWKTKGKFLLYTCFHSCLMQRFGK